MKRKKEVGGGVSYYPICSAEVASQRLKVAKQQTCMNNARLFSREFKEDAAEYLASEGGRSDSESTYDEKASAVMRHMNPSLKVSSSESSSRTSKNLKRLTIVPLAKKNKQKRLVVYKKIMVRSCVSFR